MLSYLKRQRRLATPIPFNHLLFVDTKNKPQDDKPYVTGKAYKLYDDARSQGYTFVARTVFESLDDMRYYDEGCEAHAALKKQCGPKSGGPQNVLTVYMDE